MAEAALLLMALAVLAAVLLIGFMVLVAVIRGRL
jgi:hypothetical protein